MRFRKGDCGKRRGLVIAHARRLVHSHIRLHAQLSDELTQRTVLFLKSTPWPDIDDILTLIDHSYKPSHGITRSISATTAGPQSVRQCKQQHW